VADEVLAAATLATLVARVIAVGTPLIFSSRMDEPMTVIVSVDPELVGDAANVAVFEMADAADIALLEVDVAVAVGTELNDAELDCAAVDWTDTCPTTIPPDAVLVTLAEAAEVDDPPLAWLVPPLMATAAAPLTPVATVAATWKVPMVAVLVGLGLTVNVCEKAVTILEHVAVEDSYSLDGFVSPT